MRGNLSNKLVLLVEDEESLLEGMQSWLRDNEAGYAVMGAKDGLQAYALIGRHRPDLVVSDVRMPRMSGLELLLECRRYFPNTLFIVMSAYGTKELKEQSLHYGAIRFLHKPVDLPQLERTITEILSQEPPEAQDGFLRGISVPGFVQLLNMERQTLTLNVRHDDGRSGTLVFEEGELVHASSGELTGEEAARNLLGWEKVEMIISHDRNSSSRTIHESLSFLIMDSVRVKDEETRNH